MASGFGYAFTPPPILSEIENRRAAMDNNQGSSTDKDDANPIIADLKRQLEAAKKSENEAVQRASKRYKQAHEDRRRAEIAEKEIKLLKQEINGLHQRYATLEHTGREEFAQMKSELQKAREEQALAKPNLERISQERKEYLQAYHNTMKEVNRLHQEMQQAKAVAAHGQQAMKELGAARNIADAAKKTAESAQNQCRELHRLLQESKKVNGDLQKQCVFYQGQLQQRGEEEARKKVPLTASSVALDPGSPLHPSKKRKGNDGSAQAMSPPAAAQASYADSAAHQVARIWQERGIPVPPTFPGFQMGSQAPGPVPAAAMSPQKPLPAQVFGGSPGKRPVGTSSGAVAPQQARPAQVPAPGPQQSLASSNGPEMQPPQLQNGSNGQQGKPLSNVPVGSGATPAVQLRAVSSPQREQQPPAQGMANIDPALRSAQPGAPLPPSQPSPKKKAAQPAPPQPSVPQAPTQALPATPRVGCTNCRRHGWENHCDYNEPCRNCVLTPKNKTCERPKCQHFDDPSKCKTSTCWRAHNTDTQWNNFVEYQASFSRNGNKETRAANPAPVLAERAAAGGQVNGGESSAGSNNAGLSNTASNDAGPSNTAPSNTTESTPGLNNAAITEIARSKNASNGSTKDAASSNARRRGTPKPSSHTRNTATSIDVRGASVPPNGYVNNTEMNNGVRQRSLGPTASLMSTSVQNATGFGLNTKSVSEYSNRNASGSSNGTPSASNTSPASGSNTSPAASLDDTSPSSGVPNTPLLSTQNTALIETTANTGAQTSDANTGIIKSVSTPATGMSNDVTEPLASENNTTLNDDAHDEFNPGLDRAFWEAIEEGEMSGTGTENGQSEVAGTMDGHQNGENAGMDRDADGNHDENADGDGDVDMTEDEFDSHSLFGSDPEDDDVEMGGGGDE